MRNLDSRFAEALAELAAGRHADPFALLGPHDVVRDGVAGVAVRAFLPHAVGVDLRADDLDAAAMARVHPDGVFEVFLAGRTRAALDYRLHARAADDTLAVIDDPYRYGPVLSAFDQHLFAEGTQLGAHHALGARPLAIDDRMGVHFAVWAPNAQRVSVVGDFNRWDGRVHPMRARIPSGVWEIFLPDLTLGARYKYEVVTAGGPSVLKADPYGRAFEVPPLTASVVHADDYQWGDEDWLDSRPSQRLWRAKPMSIYEVHLGSWRRTPNGRSLGYRELGQTLVPYVRDMGFTHVELLPVMEHPYGGSWGYQVTGFFAPTSRLGPPEDFKYFVDCCHQAGIGVILDWVPGHFPRDLHGLARFDGTALYEHADPRQGEHQDWGTLIFNYGRCEVRSFLLSNALFWIEEFHIDGLRVDAVASMIYLDYSRQAGEWVPNQYGGRENLEAISFLQELNTRVGATHPDVPIIAEESTAWPGVSRPVHLGGLGFGFKWNMGWMHDMLDYCRQDPIYRRYHHNRITFSMLYAFSEHFILPFSHDEVVHGKGSLIAKMPGDVWQKHASLRALLGYMFTHPGKKLLFMGSELAQWREWNHDWQLDWESLSDPQHAGMQRWLRDLNHVYAAEPSLWEVDSDQAGFQWIDPHDSDNSVISFFRTGGASGATAIIVVNFTPVPRSGYRVGVPLPGVYRERLNSDAGIYGGSNMGNAGEVVAEDQLSHGMPCSITLTVPPLAFLLLTPKTG